MLRDPSHVMPPESVFSAEETVETRDLRSVVCHGRVSHVLPRDFVFQRACEVGCGDPRPPFCSVYLYTGGEDTGRYLCEHMAWTAADKSVCTH